MSNILNFQLNYDLLFLRSDTLDKPNVHLFILADTHIGLQTAREDYLKKAITYIQDTPNSYVLLNGDLIDGVNRTSKGNIYQQLYPPDEQAEKVIELLTPIKDKILASVSGNHEKRADGHDYMREISRMLEVHHHPIAVLLELRVGRKKNNKPYTYTVYATHGYGGGSTKGAKANKLDKYSNVIVSDVLVISHYHESITANRVFAIPDLYNKKVITKKQRMILTSAWCDYGDYGMQHGFPPSSIELPEVVFYGEERGGVEVRTHG